MLFKMEREIIMLTQFSVRNFKSIKDEITLDMHAAQIKEHEDRIIHAQNGDNILPISVIYGPNGGGKSNVLESIFAFVIKVMKPIIAAQDNIPTVVKKTNIIEPFKFSENTINEPTEFDVYFSTKLAEYRYQLKVQNNVVVFEQLDRIKHETSRKSALFERDYADVKLKGDFSKLKVGDGLSETLPLLSLLGITYRKNKIVEDIMNWFMYDIAFIDYGNPLVELSSYGIESFDTNKQLYIDMMKEMGLDIIDYRIEEKENDIIEIFTKHLIEENEFELNMVEESNGTKKIFKLLPIIVNAIKNGSTLILDELDAKIHPKLLSYIIDVFTDMEKNTQGAQLIYTSHDIATMNKENFRRDEIWFVAKGREQDSYLYSLVDFKSSVRNDAKFNKQYLEGKYGADPYLKKCIRWESVNG